MLYVGYGIKMFVSIESDESANHARSRFWLKIYSLQGNNIQLVSMNLPSSALGEWGLPYVARTRSTVTDRVYVPRCTLISEHWPVNTLHYHCVNVHSAHDDRVTVRQAPADRAAIPSCTQLHTVRQVYLHYTTPMRASCKLSAHSAD